MADNFEYYELNSSRTDTCEYILNNRMSCKRTASYRMHNDEDTRFLCKTHWFIELEVFKQEHIGDDIEPVNLGSY